MRSVAPPLRPLLLLLPLVARLPDVDDLLLLFALAVTASWLVDVSRAARGGLDGGDGSPVEGTSGIPLGPCEARSAVVEALELGPGIVGNKVAAGEDVDSLHLVVGSRGDDVLAVVITTTTKEVILFHWRHC